MSLIPMEALSFRLQGFVCDRALKLWWLMLLCCMRYWSAIFLLGLTTVAGAAGGPVSRQLETIVIPKIQLEAVPLPDAVELVRQKALALDPKKKGFNVVLQIPQAHPSLTSPITITLENVPAGVALDYILRLAKLQYKVDRFAVVISPLGEP